MHDPSRQLGRNDEMSWSDDKELGGRMHRSRFLECAQKIGSPLPLEIGADKQQLLRVVPFVFLDRWNRVHIDACTDGPDPPLFDPEVVHERVFQILAHRENHIDIPINARFVIKGSLYTACGHSVRKIRTLDCLCKDPIVVRENLPTSIKQWFEVIDCPDLEQRIASVIGPQCTNDSCTQEIVVLRVQVKLLPPDPSIK